MYDVAYIVIIHNEEGQCSSLMIDVHVRLLYVGFALVQIIVLLERNHCKLR